MRDALLIFGFALAVTGGASWYAYEAGFDAGLRSAPQWAEEERLKAAEREERFADWKAIVDCECSRWPAEPTETGR